MKPKKLTGVSLAAIGLVSVISLAAPMNSLAATASYTSNATISFVPDIVSVPPLDPANPDLSSPISPVNPDGTAPEPGTGGDLSVDFASSLDFGTQYASMADEIYNAEAQKVSSGSPVANFVQISDQRLTYAGWTLSVSQPTQFHLTTIDPDVTPESGNTDPGDYLTGSSINFKKGQVRGLSGQKGTPDTVVSSFSLNGDGSQRTVLSASRTLGAGTWSYSFGDAADYSSTSSPITLSIPGITPKKAAAYTTEIVWTLSDTPGA